jgi:TolB protein
VIAVEASSGIHLIDLDGAYLRKLTDGSELLWSPVGKETIVVRGFDLHLIDEHGATVRSIDTAARLVEADESPDGQQIVFVSLFYYTTALQLLQLGDDAAPQRMVNMEYGCVRNPDWSPDGARIAFDLRCGQPPGIYVVDADGSNLRLLVRANRGEILSQPAWRPQPS